MKLHDLAVKAGDRLTTRFTVTSNGCYEWSWGRFAHGYGAISVDGRPYKAHRLIYFLYNPDADENLQVLHTCDNPPCINIAHLYLGTASNNMQDRKAAGHQPNFKGENHPGAKLTEQQVSMILVESITGSTDSQIAGRYGVGRKTINNIILGRSWG